MDCPCGFGKNIKEDQSNCHVCGADITPLQHIKSLPKQFIIRGEDFAREGLIDDAIENVVAAVTLDEGLISAHKQLGEYYAKKHLYSKSSKHYKKALDQGANGDIEKAIESNERKNRKVSIKKNIQIVLNALTILLIIFAVYWVAVISNAPGGNEPITERLNETESSSQSNLSLSSILKKELSDHPDLSSFNIEVVTTQQGLRLIGVVPTELHKELSVALAKGINTGIDVDGSGLNVVPTKTDDGSVFYTVIPGDGLAAIAMKTYGNQGSWQKIYEANKVTIDNPNELEIGQILLIPKN